LINAWQVEDALAPFFPDEDDDEDTRDTFQAEQHTYRYAVRGETATCRLDRWYVSTALTEWIQHVQAQDLGGGSDHAEVMLALADPAMRSTARTRAKAYPPKAGAATAVAATVEDALEQLKAAYERYDAEKMPAAQYLDTWEVFKVQLVTAITRVSKEAIATVNRSYKCKVARLRRRMREPGKPHAQIQSMQRELLATVTKWQGLKRRKLMVEQADRSTEATRAFFQRVAIPRAAQVVTSIRATEGAPARALDELANKMADGWMGVFTQPERPPRPALYDDLRTPKIDETTRSSLAAPFTSDEIRASLRRCKRTKSAGPDRLPNAWYRDYEDELVPVLAKLFNICHEHDVFPSSFTSATIVCLPKAGKTDNPLGFRPIALLNTD
jgi:hypothetical protein